MIKVDEVLLLDYAKGKRVLYRLDSNTPYLELRSQVECCYIEEFNITNSGVFITLLLSDVQRCILEISNNFGPHVEIELVCDESAFCVFASEVVLSEIADACIRKVEYNEEQLLFKITYKKR